MVVGAGDALLRRQMRVRDVNWISIAEPSAPVRAQVRIRNRHTPADATVSVTEPGGPAEVRFDETQRAITPGQGAVFYDGDLVLGGGWIDHVE